MEKCNDCRSTENLILPKPRRMSTRSQPHPETAVRNTQPSWLNISLDAALGCRASVFSIVKQPGKRGKSQDAASVTIHPQAAPIVFRYAFIFPPKSPFSVLSFSPLTSTFDVKIVIVVK